MPQECPSSGNVCCFPDDRLHALTVVRKHQVPGSLRFHTKRIPMDTVIWRLSSLRVFFAKGFAFNSARQTADPQAAAVSGTPRRPAGGLG